MRFEIEITQEAESDLDAIRPYYRRQILDNIEAHLRYTPMKKSRSSIKRLRQLESPAYRLKVDHFRIYYDVDESERTVTLLRVLSKKASLAYLAQMEDQK